MCVAKRVCIRKIVYHTMVSRYFSRYLLASPFLLWSPLFRPSLLLSPLLLSLYIYTTTRIYICMYTYTSLFLFFYVSTKKACELYVALDTYKGVYNYYVRVTSVSIDSPPSTTNKKRRSIFLLILCYSLPLYLSLSFI